MTPRYKTVINIPWRERAFVNVPTAAELIGTSPAGVYAMHHEGKLTLRKMAGRTVAAVSELIRLIDSAEPLTEANKANKSRFGVEGRLKRSRESWGSEAAE